MVSGCGRAWEWIKIWCLVIRITMEMQNQSINIFHPVTSNGLDYIMLCAIEYKHVYRRYAVTLDGVVNACMNQSSFSLQQGML